MAQSLAHIGASGGPLRLLGYLNDRAPVGSEICGAPVVATFDDWRKQPADVLFIAALHKAKHMKGNAARILGLGIPESRWASVVDPRTEISEHARIAPGVFVGPFTTLGANARVGSHVAVRAGSNVSHDTELGNFVFVGTGAIVCGNTRVEEGAHIAPRAVIQDGLRVGRYSVVGLGAAVLRDVPDYAIVAGNPARVIGQVGRGST
jgi:acetyltransferase EpsM